MHFTRISCVLRLNFWPGVFPVLWDVCVFKLYVCVHRVFYINRLLIVHALHG